MIAVKKNMVRQNIRKFKSGRIAKREKIVRARASAKKSIKSILGYGKCVGCIDLAELLGYYTQCSASYRGYENKLTKNTVFARNRCKLSTVEKQSMSSNSFEGDKTSTTPSLESLNRSNDSSENDKQFETSASNNTDTSFSPEDITKVSADNVSEKVEILKKPANNLPASAEVNNITEHMPLDTKSELKPTASINLQSLGCESSLISASANVLTSSTASAPSLKSSNKSISTMNPSVKALVNVGVEQLADSSCIPKEVTIKLKSVENNLMSLKHQSSTDDCIHVKQNSSQSVSTHPYAKLGNEEHRERHGSPRANDNEFPKLSKINASVVAQMSNNTTVTITPSSTLLKFKINVSPTPQHSENQASRTASVANENEGYEISLDIDLAQILELYKINKL